MKFILKNKYYFLLSALFSISSAFFIVLQTLTFEKLDLWDSGKIHVARGLTGSHAFVTTRVALAEQNLNLTAWNGGQEVYTRESVRPEKIEFNFTVSPAGYFIWEFDRDPTGYFGMRLSLEPVFKNLFFTADNKDQFIKTELADIRINKDSNHFVALFTADEVRIEINQKEIKFPWKRSRPSGQIGFRAGLNYTTVDDISIKTDAKLIFEDFSVLKPAFKLSFIIWVSLLLVGLLLVRKKSLQAFASIGFFILSLLFALFNFYDYYKIRPTYPLPTDILENTFRHFNETLQKNIFEKPEEIKIRLQDEVSHFSQSENNIYFIGSSQTWGAGARESNDTLVSTTCRELKKHVKTEVHCANAAISGHLLRDQMALLNELSMEKKLSLPVLYVVNMTSNDSQNVDYEKQVQLLISFVKYKNQKIIFFKEPNFNTASTLNKNYEILDRLANENLITVSDLNQELFDKRDSGILWWDVVHLTSHGQWLAGQFMAQQILKLSILKN